MTMPTITAGRRRAGVLLLMAASLAGCTCLCPHQAPPPQGMAHGGPPRDPALAAALRECMEALGEPRPDPAARAAPPRPTPAQRQAMDACLHGKGIEPPPPRDPAFDAAFQACRATLDLPDDRGPPSPEQHTRMQACLEEKGFERPARPSGVTPPTP